MIFLGQFPPSIAGSFCFLPVSLSLNLPDRRLSIELVVRIVVSSTPHRPRLDPSDASSSFGLEWSSSSTNTCNAVARTRQRVIRNVSSGGMLIVTISLSSSCSKFVRIRMRVIRNVTSGDRLNEMYFVYWHHPRATQSSGFVCALSVTSVPATC